MKFNQEYNKTHIRYNIKLDKKESNILWNKIL